MGEPAAKRGEPAVDAGVDLFAFGEEPLMQRAVVGEDRKVVELGDSAEPVDDGVELGAPLVGVDVDGVSVADGSGVGGAVGDNVGEVSVQVGQVPIGSAALGSLPQVSQPGGQGDGPFSSDVEEPQYGGDPVDDRPVGEMLTFDAALQGPFGDPQGSVMVEEDLSPVVAMASLFDGGPARVGGSASASDLMTPASEAAVWGGHGRDGTAPAWAGNPMVW